MRQIKEHYLYTNVIGVQTRYLPSDAEIVDIVYFEDYDTICLVTIENINCVDKKLRTFQVCNKEEVIYHPNTIKYIGNAKCDFGFKYVIELI
jgi:hypothetical protein